MKILLTFICLLLSTVALAGNCQLDELKVQRRSQNSNTSSVNYLVGNLETAFWISDKNPQIKLLLEKSYRDKNSSFSVVLNDFSCNSLRQSQKNSSKTFIDSVEKAAESMSNLNVDCIDCVKLGNAPVGLELPDMKVLKDILSAAIELDPAKVRQFQLNLYRTLKNMDPKTPQANSIIIIAFMLEDLGKLGVDKIDSAQVDHLITFLDLDLTADEADFMKKLSDQIEMIEFKKDNKSRQLVSIRTRGKEVLITAGDIPTSDQAERDNINKHLDFIKISNGATFTFSAGPSVSKKRVDITGFEMKGIAPVLGRVGMKPTSLEIDLDSKAPVKAAVQIKKGLSFTKTFPIEN